MWKEGKSQKVLHSERSGRENGASDSRRQGCDRAVGSPREDVSRLSDGFGQEIILGGRDTERHLTGRTRWKCAGKVSERRARLPRPRWHSGASERSPQRALRRSSL